MAAMAHCPLPEDAPLSPLAPLSPPPYEEAIRTAAPDVSIAMDAEGNDEPPPSYSEATKDDVQPGSDQLNTSDLMELIFPGPSSREQARRGRRSLHHISSGGRADGESEVDTQGGVQTQSRHRKKLSVCLLSAGMGVFLVAGLIAASILRHKPNMSSHKTSDLAYMKPVTMSPINHDMHKNIWMSRSKTYNHPDIGINRDLENMRKQQQNLFDALRKSLQETHNDRTFFFPVSHDDDFHNDKQSTVDPFYEEIRKISEKNSPLTLPPLKTDSKEE